MTYFSPGISAARYRQELAEERRRDREIDELEHLEALGYSACSECGDPAALAPEAKWHFCSKCSAIRNCASCDKQLPRYLMTSVEGERFCSECCHVKTEHEE